MPATATEPVLFVEQDGRHFRLRALLALGAVALADAVGDYAATSWIQVAVTGDFEHPLYGKFSITKRDLKAMRDNFKEGRHPVPPTKICMDYDHLSMDPQRPGDGAAAGWFVDMELRARGAELWAQIGWTEKGAAAIKDGEYRFVSPSFTHHKTNAQGEDIGPTVLAAAITNHPFLQGMAELSLSEVRRLRDSIARPRVVSLAEFSYGEKGARLQDALEEYYRASFTCGCCGCCPICGYGCCYCYVVDVFDAYVVYRTRDGLFRMGYALATDTGAITFDGSPSECVVNYPTLSPSASEEDPTMSAAATAVKMIKLTAADGKAVEVPESAIEGLQVVKDLRAQVADSVPKATHDQTVAQFTALTTKVGTIESTLQTERDERAKDKAKADVQALLRAGRITPAQVTPLEALALSDPDKFKSLSETFVARVGPARERETGSGDDTRPADSAAEEIDRRVATLRAADKALSAAAARNRVFAADRDLYDRYRSEGVPGANA